MPFRMRRFEESLSMHTNPTAKENLMAGSETYDTLKTLPQKARWLRGLMARLEDQVGKAVAAEIMEACGRRCIGSSVLEKARRFKQDAHDLDNLLDRLNQAHIGGGKLRREGNIIRASYERCYCGSVNQTRQPFSAVYCYCSCGWYKELFETVLEKPVKIKLIESIIQGAEICRFEIRI